jgi:predicted DNA-binding protein
MKICYTYSVKTAISLPDKLFYKADQLAKQQGISRSELYKKALEDYVEKQYSKEAIIENLNRVYGEDPGELDPAFRAVVRRMFENNEWEE